MCFGMTTTNQQTTTPSAQIQAQGMGNLSYAQNLANTPFSAPLHAMATHRVWNLASKLGQAALDAEVTRQAVIIAYVDDFRLMFVITIACMPMLLFMRKPRRAAGAEPIHAAVD